MANILDEVSGAQQEMVTTIGENFVATQAAALFGIKGSETESLTLTLYGGMHWTGSAFTLLAEQAVTLVDNSTNYVEATTAGVVSANQSAFTAGRIRLYTFDIANDGGIDLDDYVDYRSAAHHGGNADFVNITADHVTIASGTIGTSTPALAISQTWDTTGSPSETFSCMTVDITDTDSSPSSLLQRWSVGGSDKFVVKKDGQMGIGTGLLASTGILAALTGATSGTTQRGFTLGFTTTTGATSTAVGFRSALTLPDGGGATYALALGFEAAIPVKSGGGDTITQFSGFRATAATAAALNIGFEGLLTVSGTARYNLYMSGTAPNYLEGYTGIGATPSSTTRLLLTAGTTGMSSLRIPHGAAPSSPVDGDVWSTTTTLNFRLNGVTKSITMT